MALLQVLYDCWEKARVGFDRCSGVEHSWVLVIHDRTVDRGSERHHQSSERQRQQPWKANGYKSEGTDRGEGDCYDRKEIEKAEKTKLKVLMDSHSARVSQASSPSRACIAARVASVYHLHQWPQGRVKTIGRHVNIYWVKLNLLGGRTLVGRSPLAPDSFIW